MAPTASVVLLGEPDRATSDLYRRGLHAAFDVIAALDEETLLHMLRTRPLAGLVLEPAIFAAHSWEHTQSISRICAEREIPLVICSTRDERRRGRELGASTYLVKPTLPSTLLDAMHQAIEGGRS